MCMKPSNWTGSPSASGHPVNDVNDSGTLTFSTGAAQAVGADVSNVPASTAIIAPRLMEATFPFERNAPQAGVLAATFLGASAFAWKEHAPPLRVRSPFP